MDMYYDELIVQIDTLLQEENYEELRRIISIELSMPYIPKEAEDALLYAQRIVRGNEKSTTSPYQNSDVEELLEGNLDKQLIAIELLKHSNIRQHITQVKEALRKKLDPLIRSLLLEVLKEQEIMDVCKVYYDGYMVEVIPSTMELVKDSEGVKSAILYLQKWIESDNPSLFKMCVELVVKEAYYHLPYSIEEEDAQAFAKRVVVYALTLLNEDVEAFIQEHQLDEVMDFELLIASYEI